MSIDTNQAIHSDPFHGILRRLGELHDQKRRDYGSSEDPLANIHAAGETGLDPVVGVVLRMGDKMHRLRIAVRKALDLQRMSMTKKPFRDILGDVLANEGFKDSLLDMAVYSIIAMVLLEEEEEEEEKEPSAQDLVDRAEVPGQQTWWLEQVGGIGYWRVFYTGQRPNFDLWTTGSTPGALLGPFTTSQVVEAQRVMNPKE